MKRIDFKTATLLFFLLLLTFNLAHRFICPSATGLPGCLYHHAWTVYGGLIALYLISSFLLSFYPCSRFHSRNIICRGNEEGPWVSITFDDGPDAVFTPQILDILKKYQVPATFFIMGKQIAGNEKLIERIHQEGHELGNHSFDHSNLWDFRLPGSMYNDICRTEALLEQIIHKKTGFFRPPYGVINPMVESAIHRTHYRMITWSIRSFDTLVSDEDKLLHRVTDHLRQGDIILLHDNRKITAALLEKIIITIQEKGFCLVPLSRLINIPTYV
ncbi:MAG: polysaccharide deacetylase family protein [Bacteroidales bacterium]|nr:polysaccharide deacetylase family protein [Bacteroidales bacterium]